MEKIDTFLLVLRYLKDQEIVMLKDHTSFHLKDDTVIVHQKNSRFRLTINDFTELYGNHDFYLYKPSENSIDAEKDEEYYAWKSKGVN